MSIELEQLEAFVVSADHGSFSAAARYLRKAQSAVSVLVSSLEDDLDVKLFSRASRNPVLTDAGARLLPEARLLLARREHLISVARNFGDHVESRLVVAIDELYPEPAIATLFAAFAQEYPHVELELTFPPSTAISGLVLEGKADLGVMWRAEQMPDELGFHTIGWVPLVLVCGREHQLAHTAVSWEDLRSFRQIMARKHSDTAESRRLRVGAEVWWVESHWVILQILTRGSAGHSFPNIFCRIHRWHRNSSFRNCSSTKVRIRSRLSLSGTSGDGRGQPRNGCRSALPRAAFEFPSTKVQRAGNTPAQRGLCLCGFHETWIESLRK